MQHSCICIIIISFARMMRLIKAFVRLSKEELKKWFCWLPIVVMLLIIFSPAISVMTFHLHFDKHLVECQQFRHHSEECQASCIIKEMMPEQMETLAGKEISYMFSVPNLYLQNHLFTAFAPFKEIKTRHLFFRYLMLYSSPLLGLHSPPPK